MLRNITKVIIWESCLSALNILRRIPYKPVKKPFSAVDIVGRATLLSWLPNPSCHCHLLGRKGVRQWGAQHGASVAAGASFWLFHHIHTCQPPLPILSTLTCCGSPEFQVEHIAIPTCRSRAFCMRNKWSAAELWPFPKGRRIDR